MLPAERREVLEHVGRHRAALTLEVAHDGFEVGRVPQDDRARDQVERARAMALGLKPLITNPARAMEEDGSLERVLGLALVQLAGRATTFLGLLDPVEREQGGVGSG